ncbi:TetR/AcrR family transcriptional regulator [Kallotenue papyrolyticum]|uniref:TetR/AcrR family transcriptional regulator n=1 Tax=Kallotenue papyrolyticum TaxID=1325125 RepID=UPI0004927D47|nr:TetR/AcrR family transcriptional regulator [Kallotenue papyrolyticum]
MGDSQAAPSPLLNEPKQERSRQTVNAILEAAAELFASQGYNHVSTSDIAQRAGKPVGSIYTYFKDKQQILLALWDRLYKEETEAALRELELGAQVDLRATIERAVARLFERRELYRKLSPAIAYLATQNPDVAARVRELNRLALERLQHFLRRVNELGLGQVADPEAAALVIQVTTETLAGMGLPYTTQIERERVQAALTEMLWRFVGAA